MPRKTLKNKNKNKNKNKRKSAANNRPTKATRKSHNKSKNKSSKNSYFSLMLHAKKHDLPSFMYNGKTFKKKTGKGNKSHLIFYSSH